MSDAAWTVEMWSDRSAVSASLAEACEQVGAELIFRARPAEAATAPAQPALLVAVLPAGERSLSAELVEQLDAHADLCLLLLCEEALVRPTLAIQQGRIVLLEPPLTPTRIEGRLRLLMTERRIESAGSLSLLAAQQPPSGSVPQERCRTADFWYAMFMGAAASQPRALSWRTHARRGLSWALSEAMRDDVAARAWAPAPKASRDGEVEQSLRAMLGIDGALVQLDPSAREWRFLLPDDSCRLRVFSHQRLPHSWDAGRAIAKGNGRFFRLAAAPGDVVCLTKGALERLEPSSLARSALDGGGPALFQALVRDCPSAAPDVTAGVVVEVM